MKNILIINGHQKYSSAEGNLNQTLMNKMVSFLSEKNNVKTTIIQKGYKIEEEQKNLYGLILSFTKHLSIGSVSRAY